MTLDNPFIASLPSEIPLQNAPLVRVIAQVRFPLLMTIEQRDCIGPFQEAIRKNYSILRPEQIQELTFSPEAIAPGLSSKSKTIWRFSDVDGHWRVSLTSDFMALETTAYTSRSDFLRRLRELVTALSQHFEPSLIDRLGIRYIDRITGSAVKDIATLIRPEVRGITGTSVASHVRYALSETVFIVDDDSRQVQARWGYVPPKVTVDPTAIEPIDEESWILDLDMSNTTPMRFSVDHVMENATHYAERIYAIFRWAVTDDFLRRYGGKL